MKQNIRTAPGLSRLLLALALFLPLAAHAQINYQGRLTDSVGAPLPDGQYSIEFSLWDDVTGGTQIWGPFVLDGSPDPGHGPLADLVGSRFNVIIGSQDTSGESLTDALANSNAYLQIKVGSDDPITPRQIILPAPRALRADVIPNVTTTASSVDVDGDLSISGNVSIAGFIDGKVGIGVVPSPESTDELEVEGGILADSLTATVVTAGTVNVAGEVTAASVTVTGSVEAGDVNGEKKPVSYEIGTPGDTTNYHQIDVEGSIIRAYLGDANGGTVKLLLRNELTDEVRVIDEQIYIEQPDKSSGNSNGLHGFCKQSEGLERVFILGNGQKYYMIPSPWNWIDMTNFKRGTLPGLDPLDGVPYPDGAVLEPGDPVTDNYYKVSFHTAPGITGTIIIYDR